MCDLQQAMYANMQCLAGQVRARMDRYAGIGTKARGTDDRQTPGDGIYYGNGVERYLIEVPLGGPAG